MDKPASWRGFHFWLRYAECLPPGDWRNEHVGVDIASPGAGTSPGGVVIAPTDMTVVGFLEADGCVTTLQEEPLTWDSTSAT